MRENIIEPNRYRWSCRGAMPSCKIGIGAAAFRVVPTATWFPVDFDREFWDNFGMHSLVANTTRITFVMDGRYMVGGCLRWEPAASDQTRRIIAVSLNGIPGVGTPIVENEMHISHVAAVGPAQSTSTLYEFVAGDYIELCAYQTTGGNLNVTQVTEYAPIFWAQRVS